MEDAKTSPPSSEASMTTPSSSTSVTSTSSAKTSDGAHSSSASFAKATGDHRQGEENSANEEEIVFDDLTTGLIKILRNSPGVKSVIVERKSPCERGAMTEWEKDHGIQLPADLKNYYLTTDGFKLTWQCDSHMAFSGTMKINSLSELKQVGLNEPLPGEDFGVRDVQLLVSDPEVPIFGPKYKVFELDDCQGAAMICLVYKCDTSSWSVWLLDLSLDWHRLADSFTRYYRMLAMHQGLPEWYFRMTKFGISQPAQQILETFAPHLDVPFVLRPLGSPLFFDWSLDINLFKTIKVSKEKKDPNERKVNHTVTFNQFEDLL